MSPAVAVREPDINAVAPLAPNAWLRYDVVERMLPAGVNDVLEIGCGQGSFGARLARRYQLPRGRAGRGVLDGGQQRVDAAGGGEVRNVAVQELGDERFDLVCAFEVLEHIEDDAAALEHWAARLRPGAGCCCRCRRCSAGTGRSTSSSGTSGATTPKR